MICRESVYVSSVGDMPSNVNVWSDFQGVVRRCWTVVRWRLRELLSRRVWVGDVWWLLGSGVAVLGSIDDDGRRGVTGSELAALMEVFWWWSKRRNDGGMAWW